MWGIVRGQVKGRILIEDLLKQYDFEKKQKTQQQKVVIMFKSKQMATRWKNKWQNGQIFKIVPVMVNYEI